MPVSVVVGGQFGSEGKGKIALEIVRRDPSCSAVVRVGGTNSGHTGIDRQGRTVVLRQLPASAIDRNVQVVLPPGSYIDPEIFVKEVAQLELSRSNVAISPMARVITREHREWEAQNCLGATIGSTQSGTGASVLASVARGAPSVPLQAMFAEEVEALQPYLGDTTAMLRRHLNDGRRIVVEGTQGFGLSVLHGGFWPKATSRETTAAGFVAEAGLSPIDVDDVTLVIRCHPIRVAGDSGLLVGETSWQVIASDGNMPREHQEFTTVTKKVRRVGHFNSEIVRRAMETNWPTRIVLNHLDYVDWSVREGKLTQKALKFVDKVQAEIDYEIDWVGIGPDKILDQSSRLGGLQSQHSSGWKF